MSDHGLRLVTNEADIIRARQGLLGMYGALDAKRPAAWHQYGYPERITFQHFLAAYHRGGAANGAVHRLLDGCWLKLPRIRREGTDEETPWERGVATLFKRRRLWAKLRDFDRRNMVGRYAALIYRVADGKPLREPLVRAARLVDVVPLYEDQINVVDWDSDEASESFGMPRMFQYRTRPVQASDTQGRPDAWIDVHPSRVQILAEGSIGDMFDGAPLLEAGFNSLIDLEKVTGGSAENYLKNSSRTIVYEYDKDATPQGLAQSADGRPAKSVRELHEEQTRALNSNIDAAIVLKGATANTLQTQMTDPESPWSIAARTFAASVRMPMTVLFGQQTGRLASDEDRADMAERCKARQTNELTPMLEEFVQRMQAAGIIEAAEFSVEWPDIAAPTDEQRLGNAGKMTAASQQAVAAGMRPIFTEGEIREAAGYEPLPDEMPLPDPAADPAADDAEDPAAQPDPASQAE